MFVLDPDRSNGVPSGTVALETFIDRKVKHISGISFDAGCNFYAAERKDKKIFVFPLDGSGNGKDFITGLPDEPEFIMYMPKGD